MEMAYFCPACHKTTKVIYDANRKTITPDTCEHCGEDNIIPAVPCLVCLTLTPISELDYGICQTCSDTWVDTESTPDDPNQHILD